MKHTSMFAKLALAVILTSAIASCKKSQPEKEKSGFGKISYFAKASSSGFKTTALGDSALKTIEVSWSSATVWVEKISFTGRGEGLLDTTIMVEKKLNIFNADALAGVVQLPSGSYRDVKVKMYCRKSPTSDFAFDFKGVFTNTGRGVDSITVGSSFPFEADLTVTDITIDASDDYKATFNFDLNKVLTGFATRNIELKARSYPMINGKMRYIIWKGGSAEEPFYNEVIQNWQNVASVVITKQ